MQKEMAYDLLERNAKMIQRLKIFGGWWMSDGTLWARLYNTYAVLSVIYYVLLNTSQFINIFVTLDNVDEVFQTSLIVFTESLTGYKAYFIVKHIKTIHRLNEMAKHPSFQPRTKEQYAKMDSKFRLFDKMYRIHWSGPSSTMCVFILVALVNYKNFQLPFKAWYPFDILSSPNFEIAFFHQCSASVFAINVQVNVDCLCVGMMCILITQIDLLVSNLKDIGKEEKMDGTSCSAYEALISCIKHHQKILKFQKDLNAMMNGIVFGQFCLSVIAMCLSAFEMSLAEPGSLQFIACLVYAVALLIQLFIYCWWGNEIYHKSEEIPMAAFQCNWLDIPIAFRKDLVFFIRRTQKPLQLKTLNFFQITLESFKVVIKNSYSVFALLQNANSQKEELH